MAEFKIKPLSVLMGAEITGVDLREQIQKEVREKLLKAISDHLVICIKGQKLNPSELTKISRIFGTPKKYFVKDETVDNIPEVIVVSNRNKENKPKVYASHWHTDDSVSYTHLTLPTILLV